MKMRLKFGFRWKGLAYTSGKLLDLSEDENYEKSTDRILDWNIVRRRNHAACRRIWAGEGGKGD